ncbi:hypothetical protein IAI40_12130, partial [Streptococcus pseudopneumoniae]|nr:hypothetical protein [Streptococcus pseudopneumoniae]
MMVNNMRSGGRTVARYKNLGNQIAQANPMNKDRLYGDVKALALKFGANFMAPEMVSRYVLDPKGVKALNT